MSVAEAQGEATDRDAHLAVEFSLLRRHLRLGRIERGGPFDTGADRHGGCRQTRGGCRVEREKAGAGVIYEAGAELKGSMMVR